MSTTKDNIIKLDVDNVITGNNKADLLEEVKENKEAYNKKGKYQIVTMTKEPWFRITQNGRNFLSEPFKQYMLSKYEFYVVEDNYYIYADGYYKAITKKMLKSIIEKELRMYKYIDIKDNWVNEVISRIENSRFFSIEYFNEQFNIYKDIINVKNGVIKFDFNTCEYRFLEHNEEYKTTIQLNVKYNKNSKSLENWNRFLSTSLNTDKERAFLQEIMGYLLINHFNNNGQNFYCFHGAGGNGKGTLFRLFNSILSSRNVADCDADQLTNKNKQNQFYGFQFINKLLIAVSETNYDFESLSLVKKLSGGDGHKIEKKSVNETLDYQYKGKIIFSTNDKIKFRDTSKGVKRRVKFLVMDNEIKKTISNLDERLESEKESIFIWALEGLKRLIKNDFKHTLPESHYVIFEKYMEHSNNYLKFVRNHINVGGGGIIKSEIVDLFNLQYGNIYKDKDKLYDLFETELKNENINFELKKTRTKSILLDKEKVTMSYIGISYIEHKEEKIKIVVDNINKEIEKIRKDVNSLNIEDKETLYFELTEFLGKNKENELNFAESDYIKLFYESKIMYLSTLIIDHKEKDIISLCIMQLEELQEKLDRKFIIDFNELSKESKDNDFKLFKKMLIKKDTGLVQSKVSN